MTNLIRNLCINAHYHRHQPMLALIYLEVAYAASEQIGCGRACNAILKVIDAYKAALIMKGIGP